MSTVPDNIPAWKKVGLKVKESVSYDPLAAGLSAKRKRQDEPKEKKPPKRVKLPKNERKPPPEGDQLVYLRKYHKDRDSWKFSKQKQNWILKNLYSIGADYEEALVVYVNGLQGGSRDRVVEEARQVVEEWNEFMTEGDSEDGEAKRDGKEDEIEGESEKSEKSEKDSSKSQKSQKSQKKETVEQPPSEDRVRRAKQILQELTGELVSLAYLDEQANIESTDLKTTESNEPQDQKSSNELQEEQQQEAEQLQETPADDKESKHSKKSRDSKDSKKAKI